jgi:xylulokinase
LIQRWFRDQFFNVVRGQAQSVDEDLYGCMAELAARVPPGAEGLFFSPHLGGRICPAEPAMRGAWLGFSWGHTQGHFIRAMLESVAFEYAFYLNILRELIPDLKLIEARVIGGGAHNALWNQIKADVLGVPYQRLERSEFATWGCALIAGHAIGLLPNLVESAEAAERSYDAERSSDKTRGALISPNAEAHQVYGQIAHKYIQWQQTLRQAFKSQDIL